MTLQRIVHLAVEHNLDVRGARLLPAIEASRVVQADAAFDITAFAELDFEKLDTPQPPSRGGLSAFSSVQSESRRIQTGIRKTLTSGGQMTLSTQFERNERFPSLFVVNRWYTADLAIGIDQPLLRGFGQSVNLAELRLAENARGRARHEFRARLLNTVRAAENAYWQLVFERRKLAILERLLARTIDDRDRLEKRKDFDVSPVQLTEANSFVELRRADVIRARQQVRIASDRLKALIDSPDLPIADETLIRPVDTPMEEALTFSLYDAIRTALRQRPDLEQALLEINDSTIRRRVAENLTLPKLNLLGTLRYNGSDDGLRESYDQVDSADYVDYILGLRFEQPIGNRAAQARLRRRDLERKSAVLAYRRQARNAVLEVKNALRSVIASYQVVGAAEAARLSAADNLRAIEEQEKAGVALTPEFLLDLKLATQQRLADAEIQEAQALTDYNTAITDLYRATGNLLERNGITLSDAP